MQTAQGDSESVFATVLAEFAIGESEQSLSTILDSIEKIIEFAESQGINLSGGHLFSLLRTLVNAYYGDRFSGLRLEPTRKAAISVFPIRSILRMARNCAFSQV